MNEEGTGDSQEAVEFGNLLIEIQENWGLVISRLLPYLFICPGCSWAVNHTDNMKQSDTRTRL